MSREDVKEHDPHYNVPHWARIAIGGFSGMTATAVVHPLDLLKVRTQLCRSKKYSIRGMCYDILRCQGIRGLYSGITAGLLRQATYTTTRLGVYDELTYLYYLEYDAKPLLHEKVAIGLISGLAGAFTGTPSEVALIRLMAQEPDDPCSKPKPKKYKGAFDCIYKIAQEHGIKALWRGGMPTLARSVAVSATQISTYNQAREFLEVKQLSSGMTLHILASIISSFLTAVISLPVDIVKTQYQVQSNRSKTTQTQILFAIIKDKGPRYLWLGFMPYFTRLALHTMITFVMIEEMHIFYHNYIEVIKTND